VPKSKRFTEGNLCKNLQRCLALSVYHSYQILSLEFQEENFHKFVVSVFSLEEFIHIEV
jgi:hypothetical protein